MNGYLGLLALLARDLRRRRAMWLLALVVLFVVAIDGSTLYYYFDALATGTSLATAQAGVEQGLDVYMWLAKPAVLLIVVLIAVSYAPESRRNGTLQYLLTQGVSRRRVALGQYLTLVGFLALVTLVLHIGYCIPAVIADVVEMRTVAMAWVGLWVALAVIAAPIFAMSLTLGPIETAVVFLGGPLVLMLTDAVWFFVVQRLLEFFLGPELNAIGGRMVHNLQALYPPVQELMIWPDLARTAAEGGPPIEWAWLLAQCGFAAGAWICLGALLYRLHDFGSRTALK